MFLRAATQNDAIVLTQIYLAARKTYLPYAPLAHTDDAVLAWIRDFLLPTSNVILADKNGRAAGFIAISFADDVYWIDQLYLAPDDTGQGIGSALLQHVLAGATRPVRLYTFQANTTARRFYERFGFTPIAFTDGSENEEQCPDVLYELRINL